MAQGCGVAAGVRRLSSYDDGYATDVNSEIELLRADVRAEKMAIIAKHMNFTEDQSQAFWPCTGISRAREDFDDKIALIKDYAIETMNDDKQDVEAVGTGRSVCSEICGRDGHRGAQDGDTFLQVERRINRLIDTQIARGLAAGG